MFSSSQNDVKLNQIESSGDHILMHGDTEDTVECTNDVISDDGFYSKRPTSEIDSPPPDIEINSQHNIDTTDTADTTDTRRSTWKSTTDSGVFPSVMVQRHHESTTKEPLSPRRLSASWSPSPRPLSAPVISTSSHTSKETHTPLSPLVKARQSNSSDDKTMAHTLKSEKMNLPSSEPQSKPHHASPHRTSPHRGSPLRTSPLRTSPSPLRTSPLRTSPLRTSPSPHRTSPHRGSPHRTSPHRGWSEEREMDAIFSSPNSEDSIFRYSNDDECYEVWIACSDSHRAVLSVVGYNGQFTSVDEIDIGDSTVLSICLVRDKVWVGFQIGYILIFDSVTHNLVTQTWLRQYTPIISIVHIPELKQVYVTLANGSIYAFHEEVHNRENRGNRKIYPRPICEYHDLGQPANCVTAIPRVDPGECGMSHELWVGQSEAMITVLNPCDLSVITFIKNASDMSSTPSYMAYLTYTNIVYSSHSGSQVIYHLECVCQ